MPWLQFEAAVALKKMSDKQLTGRNMWCTMRTSDDLLLPLRIWRRTNLHVIFQGLSIEMKFCIHDAQFFALFIDTCAYRPVDHQNGNILWMNVIPLKFFGRRNVCSTR
ncbi:uncharacterized protein [Lolium perenne]|uniref:uncharacterized protein isoform X1 n=1 Tax=Lolium perenne TaxID=4522 RepID=UPI003A990439